MFLALSFLWFIRETKAILFWIYLWQLKEYHIGRFLAHFQTEKGKTLILNSLNFLKVLFLVLFLILTGLLPFLLLVLYSAEFLKAIRDFLKKKLKRPILTKKTIVLIFAGVILELLFLSWLLSRFENIGQLSFGVLVFDLLTPVISSAIVLLFQPVAALWRWFFIQKAKKKRALFRDLLVIGITGSYGKTSTKEFLAEILSQYFNVLKTKEHQNSEVGISQCILNELNWSHQIFVCEMAAYNKGGIKLLCNIAQPSIGIVTGVNEQHLALFGSMENLLSAEGGKELVEALPQKGVIILNISDPHIFSLYQKIRKIYPQKKILTYGVGKVADNIIPDLFVKEVLTKKRSISFSVITRDRKSASFNVKVIGEHNVENILAAVLVARYLGIPLKRIAKDFRKIKPEILAVELKKVSLPTKRGKKQIFVIDATYSANPDGVMAHLEYLKIWKGKKIIVMCCLIELGKAAKRVHRKIGEAIGQVCDLAIITTKDYFKEIREGAQKAGMLKEKVLFLEKPKEIFEKIKSFCKRGDIVLLESRIPKEVIEWLSK
jgi:UDP-N-acetylmuramoyl-tripeptide--D-alanyl-D-alanine ligase